MARLVTRFHAAEPGTDLVDFLRSELAPVLVDADGGAPRHPGTDVVLYGFGRIGRLLARILIAHAGGGQGLRLAIVVRKGSEGDLVKRASLLRTTRCTAVGAITVDEEANTILANGTLIQVIYSDDPGTIDYTAYGISDAIVVDNTGRWRDEGGLSRQVDRRRARAAHRTGQGRDQEHRARHQPRDHRAADRILSAASCTTNAITPVLAAIEDAYGIVRGHVETVHSFTNENLIDNFHEGDRRWPLGGAEHGHRRDRRGEGRVQGAARARGQAHGQRHPCPRPT